DAEADFSARAEAYPDTGAVTGFRKAFGTEAGGTFGGGGAGADGRVLPRAGFGDGAIELGYEVEGVVGAAVLRADVATEVAACHRTGDDSAFAVDLRVGSG